MPNGDRPVNVDTIPVDQIVTGTNDRKVFDLAELEQLAASIAAVGLAEPIAVRPLDDGRFRLIAGERRWRAYQLLGRVTIEATIRDVDEQAEADLMLAENTGRVNLSIMEEARAYGKRRDAGQTVEQIAAIAGVAEFRVRWRLDLLELGSDVQAAIDAEAVTPAAALELRRLDSAHQSVGLKAWLANPRMGAVRFRKLVDEIAAEQAKSAEMQFGFALQPEPWIDKAKAMTGQKRSVAALLDLTRRMSDTLTELGYDGPLLTEAQSMQ